MRSVVVERRTGPRRRGAPPPQHPPPPAGRRVRRDRARPGAASDPPTPVSAHGRRASERNGRVGTVSGSRSGAGDPAPGENPGESGSLGHGQEGDGTGVRWNRTEILGRGAKAPSGHAHGGRADGETRRAPGRAVRRGPRPSDGPVAAECRFSRARGEGAARRSSLLRSWSMRVFPGCGAFRPSGPDRHAARPGTGRRCPPVGTRHPCRSPAPAPLASMARDTVLSRPGRGSGTPAGSALRSGAGPSPRNGSRPHERSPMSTSTMSTMQRARK